MLAVSCETGSKLITQSRASQAEIVAGEGFHHQRNYIFAEFFSSRAQHQLQRVRSRSNVEGILVIEGAFGEIFESPSFGNPTSLCR